MLQEEIARLTGTLKFNVEARPLVAFEKKLTGVMSLLREFSGIANKKFTVKVALDSKSLRAQIEKATKTKISLTNIDISNEALALQSKRIQEYLDKTTIRLSNVKIDIAGLVNQKKLVKTLMGQMQIDLPIKLGLTAMEAELRRELRVIGARNPVRIAVELNHSQLVQRLRHALRQAQKGLGALQIRVGDPQVRLRVDRQHLINEIQRAIGGHEFSIRVGARGNPGNGGHAGAAGAGLASGAMGFARGALPGLGAAFALSQMNQISQQVTAATNSLEAVSGSKENFDSNNGFLKNLSKEQGLTLRSMMPQYSSIYQAAAPSIGVKGTQDMFRGISKYGTVHGIDKEAMKGSMTALSQMFGKDKIQAEEARQQFAERMPNGMALLAQAAGNSGQTKNGTVAEFSDLMQKGKADPKKILPELGRLMEAMADKNDAYAKSLNTTRVAQGRMNATFEDSVVLFGKGGFDNGMKGFFNTMSDSMQRAAPLIEALGVAFEWLLKPINAIIRLVGMLGENWGKISEMFGVSKGALAAFATAVALFMLPFGGFLVAISAAALILDDLFTYMRGGKSVFGDMVNSIPGATEQIDNIVFAFDHVKAAMADVGTAFDDLVKKYPSVFSDIDMENPLVTVLREVSKLVDNIASGLDRVAAVMRGDFSTGFKGLAEGYKERVIDNSPGYKIMNFGLEKGKNFLESYRGHETMPVPSPLVQPMLPNIQPLQTGPISLNLNVQAPSGVSDPIVFGDALGIHVQTLLDDSIKKMLGGARAQQAERK